MKDELHKVINVCDKDDVTTCEITFAFTTFHNVSFNGSKFKF